LNKSKVSEYKYITSNHGLSTAFLAPSLQESRLHFAEALIPTKVMTYT